MSSHSNLSAWERLVFSGPDDPTRANDRGLSLVLHDKIHLVTLAMTVGHLLGGLICSVWHGGILSAATRHLVGLSPGTRRTPWPCCLRQGDRDSGCILVACECPGSPFLHWVASYLSGANLRLQTNIIQDHSAFPAAGPYLCQSAPSILSLTRLRKE